MQVIHSIIEVLPMSAALRLKIGSVVGVIIGLLTATGHLDASNANSLANDFTTLGGAGLTLISAVYYFEHDLVEVKDDLKNTVWAAPTAPTQTQPSVSASEPSGEAGTPTAQ